VASAATVAAAALLPWHRSGSVRRNAFALARVADNLGLVTDGPRRALFTAVFLLPLLAAAVFLAAVAGNRRLVGASSCVAGIVGLASGAVVVRLSGGRQVGPVVAIAAAVTAVGCGLHLAITRKASDG
jgi:hypothetical protein